MQSQKYTNQVGNIIYRIRSEVEWEKIKIKRNRKEKYNRKDVMFKWIEIKDKWKCFLIWK